MSMTPGLRKFALTAHITSSVGWLGAVAAFLVLSIAGLTSAEVEIVRSSYVAMNLIGKFLIVPLSLAALLTGLVQSLGTPWGLFRYYWVLVKFALTIGATLLLLLHQFTAVAEAARRVSVLPAGILPGLGGLGIQLAGDAGAAVVVLIAITLLSVFKPWGKTRYGLRKDARERHASSRETALTESPATADLGNDVAGAGLPLGIKILLALLGVILASVVVLHLARGGLGHHGH